MNSSETSHSQESEYHFDKMESGWRSWEITIIYIYRTPLWAPSHSSKMSYKGWRVYHRRGWRLGAGGSKYKGKNFIFLLRAVMKMRNVAYSQIYQGKKGGPLQNKRRWRDQIQQFLSRQTIPLNICSTKKTGYTKKKDIIAHFCWVFSRDAPIPLFSDRVRHLCTCWYRVPVSAYASVLSTFPTQLFPGDKSDRAAKNDRTPHDCGLEFNVMVPWSGICVRYWSILMSTSLNIWAQYQPNTRYWYRCIPSAFR